MKENEFTNLLEDLCRESHEYKLTDYEKRHFWGQYLELIDKEWTEYEADSAYAVTQFDEEKRLIYREGLANRGNELTPRQVDIFIVMLEIILSVHETENA